MSDALIPFALNSNDRLVEVFDVPGGKQCRCRCPSCRQSVIARQGKQKVWHFAHDPNAEAKPNRACELSFYSCCRLYLMEQALAGELNHIVLPELSLEEWVGKYRRIYRKALVTEERKIQVSEYLESGPYDLSIKIGDYTLALHIQYPGRLLPDIPNNAAIGLLSVDITALKLLYQRGTNRKARILPLLKSLFGGSKEWSGTIKWLHHPRAESIRVKLRESLLKDYDAESKQAGEKSTVGDESSGFNLPPLEPVKLEVEREGKTFGTFQCLKCYKEWEGHKFFDATCNKCKTHLYSRFQAVIC